MKKTKNYGRTKFDSKTLYAAERAFRSLLPEAEKEVTYVTLDVQTAEARWSYNTLEEFLAAADQGDVYFHAITKSQKFELVVRQFIQVMTIVVVSAPTRKEIESVSAIFENNFDRCRLPEPKIEEEVVRVFIGHGQNSQWRDLKDHLHEKHNYDVEAYEIGSRAGHTIRDILEEMLEGSSFALLVMTGEDKTKDGKLQARQNVVHEAGLFQGKLGFSRAIILLEEGTEEFSNIHGLQQIRFSKGKIIETFGEVLAVLRREVG